MGNSKEADADADARASTEYGHGYLPPPAYQETNNNRNIHPPRGPAPAYNLGESSSGAEAISSVSSRFPPVLNAYFHAFSSTFHLGEQKGNPCFAVRMHSGFTKNPILVLHDGPTEKDPVFATVTRKSLMAWTLTAPAREGIAHDTESQSITLSRHIDFKHQVYRFMADVGAGQQTHSEEFEWRSSHGSEVKELNGYKWGWKLVRLSSQTLGTGSARETRALGATSDGHEVVAVWAHNKSLSMSKVFKFECQGSAQTGMLGDRGRLLALMSAIVIWQEESNSSTPVVAGVQAGVAAGISAGLSAGLS
ncbi:hypothetical protein F5Y14DRAFT_344998 [Nemania sp. NC0429]|nr:hypothetical protein F5Y14DRAFT_344998 [Nemania sp. NC0429]